VPMSPNTTPIAATASAGMDCFATCVLVVIYAEIRFRRGK
jgi:hypothetical protein